MESSPATEKTKEKARKYHFFPRKSMLGFRKNSTGCITPFLSEAYPNKKFVPEPLPADRLVGSEPSSPGGQARAG
jgi:hypothetical protein